MNLIFDSQNIILILYIKILINETTMISATNTNLFAKTLFNIILSSMSVFVNINICKCLCLFD